MVGTVRPSRGSAAIVTSPSRRTVTSSHSAITSSRMWETKTTPTSRSRRTRRISSSVPVLAAPSAEVGSSRIRIRGSVSSALPISTSWRWARLSSATGVRRSTSRPSSSTHRARSGGHLGAVDERAAAGLAQREQVGEHVEVGEDVELLRHDRDAVADRLGGGAEVDFLVVEADRAGVGGERAGDDLHQRRLAGAVLTQESVHGAGADREVRAGQRDDAAVRLANASRFEHALTPWAG